MCYLNVGDKVLLVLRTRGVVSPSSGGLDVDLQAGLEETVAEVSSRRICALVNFVT